MKPMTLRLDYSCCELTFEILVDFTTKKRQIRIIGKAGELLELEGVKFCPCCGKEVPYPRVNGQAKKIEFPECPENTPEPPIAPPLPLEEVKIQPTVQECLSDPDMASFWDPWEEVRKSNRRERLQEIRASLKRNSERYNRKGVGYQ